MIFSDGHMHSNPVQGLGMSKIAKKFVSEGGWLVVVVSLPPYHYGINELGSQAYERVIEILNREAKIARSYGLKAVRLAGFHPAEIDEYYRRGISGRDLFELVEGVVSLYEKALKDGLIDGIGEIGRQHYATAPDRIITSEIVMSRFMELARDYNAVVHLHLEQGGWVTVYSIMKLLDRIGFFKNKTIIHHANHETARHAESYGLPYTLPIKKFEYRDHIAVSNLAMIESDYIDDPRRPGVSAYPWEIPAKISEMLSQGQIRDEVVYRLMVDNPSRIYGVSPP